MGEKGAALEAEMKGWLYKWTNYIRGYQKRWFVLNNVTGLLSYYRSPQEVAHTCRGTVSLKGASITTEDSNNFVISASCGTQTWHLKASNEVFRQQWVTALELAKAKASNCSEDEEDEEDILDEEEESAVDRSGEHRAVIRMLNTKLDEMRICHEVLVKQGGSLVASLQNLESLLPKQHDHQVVPHLPPEFSSLTKTLGERVALFRLTCTATINACKDYADLANAQGKKWQRLLQHERDQRLKMEEMVETLARQHSHLERSVVQQEQQQHPQQPQPVPQELSQDETAASSSDNDDMEFFDAVEENEADFIVHSATAAPSLKPSEQHQIAKKQATAGRKRRTTIPERPNVSVNLWSIMKNCIGKELTKIPMPVNFSEPLSLLQRLTEEYEYGYLLDQAASCTDPWEQLAYIAAFTISPYAATAYRTGKPFNPLLGETYEWDRTEDLGWRALSEQVSHHPPVAAQHCEGKNWTVYQEFSMSSKFRGKYLQIVPLGTSHLFINNNSSSGDGAKNTSHFTWRKVSTTVHNIIVGKLWVDNHGEMDIVNHTTGDKCHLKFIPYSYFSREAPRRVTGYVTAKDGTVKWVVSGTWDSEIGAAKVLKYAGSGEGGKPVLETGPVKTLWSAHKIPPGAERWYNLSEMAIQLNEMEEGVAPTDARRRPDQRFMEEGKWDEANQEKVRLEEKQRATRRKREVEAEQAASEGKQMEPYKPLWFEQQRDPDTGAMLYRFNEKYWEFKENQNWSMCPDIF